MNAKVDLTEDRAFDNHPTRQLTDIQMIETIDIIDEQMHSGHSSGGDWSLYWCEKSFEAEDYQKNYCGCCGRLLMPWYTGDTCPHCHYGSDMSLSNVPWGKQDNMISVNIWSD